MKFAHEKAILDELSKAGIDVEVKKDDIFFYLNDREVYHHNNKRGISVIYKGEIQVKYRVKNDENEIYIRFFNFTLDSFENIPEESTCTIVENKEACGVFT